MKEFENFFMNELPGKLRNLTEGTSPGWGTMNPSEMVDHLRIAVEISMENVDGEVRVEPEEIERNKAFLMSDTPFKKHLERPKEYDERPATEGGLEKRKVELMKKLVEMFVFFDRHPEHLAVHPSFGNLHINEWLHLHKKHFMHHLKQFDLV